MWKGLPAGVGWTVDCRVRSCGLVSLLDRNTSFVDISDEASADIRIQLYATLQMLEGRPPLCWVRDW
jgi:hypothetical protein